MKSMKQSDKTKQWSHRGQWGVPRVRAALASAAFALLAACGGGDGGSSQSGPVAKVQVVSFGDSLSDAGTYSKYVLTSFGGGRFTTNPGTVWTQDVAAYYGGSLAPAVYSGFGQPIVDNGGLDYAQGGARVTDPNGIGTPTVSAVPVTTQLDNYLAKHGSFNAGQLVLVQGGANDIFYNALVAAAAGNTSAAQLAAMVAIVAAGQQLASIVQRIVDSGATKVVVVNVPDIGGTPQAVSTGTQTALTTLSKFYNNALLAKIQALGLTGKVLFVDVFTWQDGITAAYAANGFQVSNTDTACNLTAMQTKATAYATQNPSVLPAGETPAQFGASLASSLFCSPETLTVAGADQTYMFADSVHPTTHLHALFAQYVEQQIAAAGLVQ